MHAIGLQQGYPVCCSNSMQTSKPDTHAVEIAAGPIVFGSSPRHAAWAANAVVNMETGPQTASHLADVLLLREDLQVHIAAAHRLHRGEEAVDVVW